MSETFDADDRPRKRVKTSPVSDTSNIHELPLANEYLVLAEHSSSCTYVPTEIHKALLKSSLNCSVSSISTEKANNVELVLRIQSQKQPCTTNIPIPDARGMMVLEEVARLPVIHEKRFDLNPAVVASSVVLRRVDGQTELNVQLLWHDTARARDKMDPSLLDLLRRYLPPEGSQASSTLEAWDVREFYDNVHVPDTDNDDDVATLDLERLNCQLYPFQRRAAKWMMGREGVRATAEGRIVPIPQPESLPFDFQHLTTNDKQKCYVSHTLGVVSTSLQDIRNTYTLPRGGILAEAMGLGKTVEMIALICTHSKEKSPVAIPNPKNLKKSGATLVITPPTILQQWEDEIREHAPSLRVYRYEGATTKAKREAISLDLLAESDVVLTTYNVIAKEVHYVAERPDRNLRARPRAVPPKSPLTQIMWFRCLLDEAQMIESGVSHAATVARLIPRVMSWAVTGTPLKQSHRDIYGLLLFLSFQPWSQSTRLWDDLVLRCRPLFRELISTIALRHSKEMVRHELRIPSQSRKTITIPFTAIEESHYAQLHHDMQEEVGLDRFGGPLSDDWDPHSSLTIERMRHWLQRLRQTCLHPEVGGRNRKALGRSGGPLRTVAQVLDVMIEQADSAVHTERRNFLSSKSQRAQMLEHARKSLEAQEIFKEVYREATIMVEQCREEIAEQDSKVLDDQAARAHDDAPSNFSDDEDQLDQTRLVARQRLRSALEIQHISVFFIGNTFYQLKEQGQLQLSKFDVEMSDVVDEATRDEVSGEQSARQDAAAKSNNRIVTHWSSIHAESMVLTDASEASVKDLVQKLEDAETTAYEEAKSVRTELLKETHRKAERLIRALRTKTTNDALAPVPELRFTEDDSGGIESRKVFDKLYHFCKAMNDQATQLQATRERLVGMLTSALVDEDDGVELTGEEYESSTKHQDEMYVIVEMLRALFSDRNAAITGQENLLTKTETKNFLREAKEGNGPAPELMIKLQAERHTKRIDIVRQGSLRGILSEIRSLATSLEWQEENSTRAKAELVIVNKLLRYVQQLLTAQTKAMAVLEQEVQDFRGTMNARLSYYAALQQISDSVAPYGEEETIGEPVDETQYQALLMSEDTAYKKYSTAASKRRYLLHLRDESASEESARICTICQFEFEVGTLTVCGHQFCKECITLWYKEHRNCPVCKRRLQLADFYDVTYKPSVLTVQSEGQAVDEQAPGSPHAGVSSSSRNGAIYTDVAASTLDEIKNIEVKGSSYGSKVDMLCRHILYLREREMGSKAVVFSQYRDFLDVLARALRQNGIIYSKFDDKDGIVDFKSNPANQCFLLHAKAHAAGLNLVVASHVILCEPLINTAIELQAIARVHRIGQQSKTTVWMYLIADTVEEAIYDISVKRRLAHMPEKEREESRHVSRTASRAQTPQAFENEIEAANSKEMQGVDLNKMFAAGKGGGEMVDQKDLWQCLFGKINRTDDVGVRMGLLNAPEVAASANGEIGRFLRAEAAESRLNI